MSLELFSRNPLGVQKYFSLLQTQQIEDRLLSPLMRQDLGRAAIPMQSNCEKVN